MMRLCPHSSNSQSRDEICRWDLSFRRSQPVASLFLVLLDFNSPVLVLAVASPPSLHARLLLGFLAPPAPCLYPAGRCRRPALPARNRCASGCLPLRSPLSRAAVCPLARAASAPLASPLGGCPRSVRRSLLPRLFALSPRPSRRSLFLRPVASPRCTARAPPCCAPRFRSPDPCRNSAGSSCAKRSSQQGRGARSRGRDVAMPAARLPREPRGQAAGTWHVEKLRAKVSIRRSCKAAHLEK